MKSWLMTLGMALAILVLGNYQVEGAEKRSGRSARPVGKEVRLSKEVLLDKIKGGWAGQTIGCTYGSVTEFKYRGTMINDNINIEWPEHWIKFFFDRAPGLYDDVYMDLTFVDVFERLGLDAPQEAFAEAFADADYLLWHANQNARYNLLNGMKPGESGFWMNNPHCDDIDFQIEADYAGLMSPGMVNTAVHYTDDIGHIMCYGDGWYGGAYVAAMYALAFVSDDVNYIVNEALKVIPEQSRFHRCISDVIKWHKMYPDNWELTWARCQKEWSFDIGCPTSVYVDTNIDAVTNSAYVVMGLLYGGGNFYKTIDISTRCGQDSDCNPATAGGILATMLGYSNIPEYWMPNLREVEDRGFAYKDISLNDVYGMSFRQALQVIERNGGKVCDDYVVIAVQKPEAVRLEQSFQGYVPVSSERTSWDSHTPYIEDVKVLCFTGNGVSVPFTYACGWDVEYKDPYVAEVEVWLDDEMVELVKLPVNKKIRKDDLFVRFGLEKKPHRLYFKLRNPDPDHRIRLSNYTVYSDSLKVLTHDGTWTR